MVNVHWRIKDSSSVEKREAFDGIWRAGDSIYDLAPVVTYASTAFPTVAKPGNLFAIVYPNSDTNRRLVSDALYAGRISNLYRAIGEMGSREEDEEFFLDQNAVRDATMALDLFVTHNVPPPSVFPNGSEALIFKWDDGHAARYAYLLEGRLTFKLYAPNDHYPVTVDIELRQPDMIARLLGLLHPQPYQISNDVG